MTLHPGNLAGKGPMGLKQAKPARASKRQRRGEVDASWLADVRRLPCVICEAWGYRQTTQTEAHHPICGRHSQERVPDREALPLCDGHHQGNFDTAKIAIHRDRTLWVDTYGSDREYIAITQDAVERLRGNRT